VTAVATAPPATAANAFPDARLDGFRDSTEFPGATAEQRLRAALDAAHALTTESFLVVSEPVVLTAPLTIDLSRVSMEFAGGDVDATAVSGSALVLTASEASDDAPHTRVSLRGLRLTGPGRAAPGSVGLELSSATGVRGAGLYGVEIIGFETGVRFGPGAEHLRLFHVAVEECGTGVLVAGTAPGSNLAMVGGSVRSCTTGLSSASTSGELHTTSLAISGCDRAVEASGGAVTLHAATVRLTPASTVSAFSTAATTTARISINGGTVSAAAPLAAATVFETAHRSWGGGIVVTSTSFRNVAPASGYLVGGTGLVRLADVSILDEPSVVPTSVLVHRAANRLVDGAFDLGTVADAYLDTPDATSRSASPSATLAVASGRLLVRKTGTGQTSLSFDVLSRPGQVYAADLVIGQAAANGSMIVSESFVTVSGRDARGIPVTVRSEPVSSTTQSMAAMAAALPFRVRPATGVDRQAPSWASHFRVTVGLNDPAAGTVGIDDAVVTEM
jgi:hypothetical protein